MYRFQLVDSYSGLLVGWLIFKQQMNKDELQSEVQEIVRSWVKKYSTVSLQEHVVNKLQEKYDVRFTTKNSDANIIKF